MHRRIDIILYRKSVRAFGLFAWTGDSDFNRAMKLRARKMGYMLSDHGLYPVARSLDHKEILGPSVQCETERDIFEALKVAYREPEARKVEEFEDLCFPLPGESSHSPSKKAKSITQSSSDDY